MRTKRVRLHMRLVGMFLFWPTAACLAFEYGWHLPLGILAMIIGQQLVIVSREKGRI